MPDTAVSYLAKHGAADQGHMNEVRISSTPTCAARKTAEAIVQVSKVEFALYGQIVEHAASEGA